MAQGVFNCAVFVCAIHSQFYGKLDSLSHPLSFFPLLAAAADAASFLSNM